MAFRRGFQRGSSRSEKSCLGLSSLSPLVFPLLRIEEQELDKRLKAFEAIVCLQRKRRCIEVLERSEDLDEPTGSKYRSVFPRRYKSDIWSKLQLLTLKYKG